MEFALGAKTFQIMEHLVLPMLRMEDAHFQVTLYDNRTASTGNITSIIGNNVLASPLGVSDSLPRTTHQVGLDAYTPSLDSYNVQTGHGAISGRDLLGSNLPSGATRFMPYYFNGNGTVSNANVINAEQNMNMLRYVNGMCLLPSLTFLQVATTQQGSVLIQDVLISNPDAIARAVNMVIEALDDGIPIIFCLMVNEYGCQVVSRLVYASNRYQLAQIVDNITSDCSLFLVTILNKYGSNLLVKLIHILKQSPLFYKIVNNLSKVFYRAMIDRHGSYVICHCIRVLDYEQNKRLYEEATKICFLLATHKQGCIALNNFITAAKGRHMWRLLHFISDNVVILSQDDSGNYVVQKVLGLEKSEFTVKMSFKLRGFYANLSMQKSGSHVVERILKSRDGMNYAVEDLINCNELLQVTQNPYGNYVIQTALKVTRNANSLLYLQLLDRLLPYYAEIQSGFGRNVYNLIEMFTKIDFIVS